MTQPVRCPWGDSTEDYQRYHDEEWGVELRGVPEMFERLTLEGTEVLDGRVVVLNYATGAG